MTDKSLFVSIEFCSAMISSVLISGDSKTFSSLTMFDLGDVTNSLGSGEKLMATGGKCIDPILYPIQ